MQEIFIRPFPIRQLIVPEHSPAVRMKSVGGQTITVVFHLVDNKAPELFLRL